jgi:heterodisulfide reductase subunit A-like polyferredoxin
MIAPVPYSQASPQPDPLSYFARLTIQEALSRAQDIHEVNTTPLTLLPDLERSTDCRRVVGIIGAGAAGLYAAMMLEDLGIPYEILEAGKRVGGRLYTHHFPNGSEYDYFVSKQRVYSIFPC